MILGVWSAKFGFLRGPHREYFFGENGKISEGKTDNSTVQKDSDERKDSNKSHKASCFIAIEFVLNIQKDEVT